MASKFSEISPLFKADSTTLSAACSRVQPVESAAVQRSAFGISRLFAKADQPAATGRAHRSLTCARRISIMSTPRTPSMRLRTQQLMIEFTDILDRPLQLLIIVEPTANLGDALATHAELLRAPAGVGQVTSRPARACDRMLEQAHEAAGVVQGGHRDRLVLRRESGKIIPRFSRLRANRLV